MSTLFERYGKTARPDTLHNARRAYKLAALVLHPDKRGGSETLMAQLNAEMAGWERHFAQQICLEFKVRGDGELTTSIPAFGAALSMRRAYWPAFVRAFYDVEAWATTCFQASLARLALWRYEICVFLARPAHRAYWKTFGTVYADLLPNMTIGLTVGGALFCTPFDVPREKLSWLAEQVPCPPAPVEPSDWRYFDELVTRPAGLPSPGPLDKDDELEALRATLDSRTREHEAVVAKHEAVVTEHAEEVARLHARIEELSGGPADAQAEPSLDEPPPKRHRLDETLAMSSDKLLGYLTTCCEILINCAIHPDGGGFGIYDFIYHALKLDIPGREEHRRVYRTVMVRISKAYKEKRARGFFMPAVPGDPTIYVSFDATRIMDTYVKELVQWQVMARSIWQSAFLSTPAMIEASNDRLKAIARSEAELHFMRRIMGMRDVDVLVVEGYLLQLRLYGTERTVCGFMMKKYRCVNKVVRCTKRCGRHMNEV